MTATTTTELPAPEHPAQARLRLIGDGWRTLDTATDPRRKVAAEGTEVTICHFPDFATLGVARQMFKEGRREEPSAAYTEVYRRGKTSWLPV